MFSKKSVTIHGGQTKARESIMQIIKWEFRVLIAGTEEIENFVLDSTLCCCWGISVSILEWKYTSSFVVLLGFAY